MAYHSHMDADGTLLAINAPPVSIHLAHEMNRKTNKQAKLECITISLQELLSWVHSN